MPRMDRAPVASPRLTSISWYLQLRWAESKQTGSRESGRGEVDLMPLIGLYRCVVGGRPPGAALRYPWIIKASAGGGCE